MIQVSKNKGKLLIIQKICLNIIQSIKVNRALTLQYRKLFFISNILPAFKQEMTAFQLLSKPLRNQSLTFSNLSQFNIQTLMAKDMQLLYVLKAGGIDHLSAKRYAEASIYFQDVLSNFEQCLGNIDSSTEMQKVFRQLKLSSHKNLSLCYLKLNQFQKCVHQCKIILEIQPNCLKIIYRIGRAYISMQKYQQAKTYLTVGFHLDPQEKQIMKALEEIQQIDFTKNEADKIKNTSIFKQLFSICMLIALFLFDKLISPLRWLGILKEKVHTT